MSARRPLRPLIAVLVAVIVLELAYLLIGNWFLSTRLDAAGIRAIRPLTLYPGDVRASQIELTAAGGTTLRATRVRGVVHWRSLFTDALELRWIEAGRVDARVSELAALLGLIGKSSAEARAISPASLVSPFAKRTTIIDVARASFGEVQLGNIEVKGEGRVELRSLRLAQQSAAGEALIRAQRLTATRLGAQSRLATFSGELRLSLASSDRGAVCRSACSEPQVTVALRGTGSDAATVFDAIGAPASVRWMFEELNGQPYTFRLAGTIRAGRVRLKRVEIETSRVVGRGVLQLGSKEPRGALLLERGPLRIGILLAGRESKIVTPADAQWLDTMSQRFEP